MNEEISSYKDLLIVKYDQDVYPYLICHILTNTYGRFWSIEQAINVLKLHRRLL